MAIPQRSSHADAEALRRAAGGLRFDRVERHALRDVRGRDAVPRRTRRSPGAQAGTLRTEGPPGHLPVHDRRRLARRFVRPQAEAVRRRQQDGAGGQFPGQARRLHDVPQESAVRLPAGRFVRDRGERPVPAHAVGGGRPLRDPVDVVGPHQPLRGDARHAHRVVHLRPAEHRRLGQLRPGHGESEPALVRGGGPSAPLCGHPDLGVGLPARLPPGHPHRARPDADRQRETPGQVGRAPAARARDGRRRQSPGPRASRGRCGGRGPDPVVRNRIRDAARGPGGVRPLRRIGRDTEALRPGTGPHRRFRAGNAWSAVGWPSAGSGSSN